VRTTLEVRLGELLIEEGLITEEQLVAALAEQRAAPAYVPLGQVLVNGGQVTQKQLTIIMDRNNKRLSLGQILLRNGSITEAQLQVALQRQVQQRRPLGEVLVKSGVLTDDAMRQALAIQLNIPYLDLDHVSLDRSLGRAINKNYARRHSLVPVSTTKQTLTISMNDPTNTAVVEELSQSSGMMVNVVTSSADAIKRAFQRLYDEAQEGSAPAATADASDLGLDDGDVSDHGKRRYVDEYAKSKRADAAVWQLLSMAIDRGSSDIHLESLAGRLKVRFRIDGMLHEIDLGPGKDAFDQNAREIISRVKILGKLDISERRRPQDGAFRVKIDRGGATVGVDFRVSVLPGYYGESVVLRILDKARAPTSIDQIGFSPLVTTTLRNLLQRPSGILLITGPTGSGKSTTLYASLMTVYRPEIRILTAEDPIEYIYEQFSQSEVNERIGNTFARYLRAFLRHDPEVIMVGEIRDEETAEMGFRAAQTGHLLLSTLHTNDAISALPRLLDLKVDPNIIASSLIGVLAQRLVRQVCTDCRQEYSPPADLIREFFDTPDPPMKFYQGGGCPRCNFTGYRGRMSVGEIWVPSERDVILISKNAPFDEIRTNAQASTVPMAVDVMARLTDGRTTLEELIRVLPYSSVYQFRQLAKGVIADA
jgi:type II secretory ATPase GspE/PulE/Tfp pilus assembly ATPase PilB-like protein